MHSIEFEKANRIITYSNKIAHSVHDYAFAAAELKNELKTSTFFVYLILNSLKLILSHQ